MGKIKEFHLFAGIGGGIYGGHILGHECCGAVEIDQYCQTVLGQRIEDGWMNNFEIHKDITKLDGSCFKGKFDILCGGFPCQAFSHAAHGANIKEKNLWPEMFRFAKESDAQLVFCENVTLKAIEAAASDLESVGYKVKHLKLSCSDIGGDHRRERFWALASKDDNMLFKILDHLNSLPKFSNKFWQTNPTKIEYPSKVDSFSDQKRGTGNAQVPMVAATAFRILANMLASDKTEDGGQIYDIIDIDDTWIKTTHKGENFAVHTPTTMANYHCKSMQKHPSCRNFVRIFGKPTALNQEYLMGFPIGASSPYPQSATNFDIWRRQIYKNKDGR